MAGLQQQLDEFAAQNEHYQTENERFRNENQLFETNNQSLRNEILGLSGIRDKLQWVDVFVCENIKAGPVFWQTWIDGPGRPFVLTCKCIDLLHWYMPATHLRTSGE